MNGALWKKAWLDMRWQLLASAAFLFMFLWLRVWLTSQMSLGQFRQILYLLPEKWERLSPVPFAQVATSAGRIALGYDEPLVLLVVSAWALARGSDAVSGEIGRGTMEMILAQPVRRTTLLLISAAGTLLGAALLALASWLGLAAGIASVQLEEPVTAGQFVPAAVNLFSLTACLAGLTTLVSSFGRERWGTLGAVGVIYVIELSLKVVARVNLSLNWLLKLTFFTAFEPQVVASDPGRAWSWWINTSEGGEFGPMAYHGLLLGLAALSYLLATWIFARRDVPAPL